MPLINAIQSWLERRARDAAYSEPNALAVLWWPTILVLLPVLFLLVVIGVMYELIVRIDRRRRLDQWTLWTLSGIAGLSLVAVLGWWLFYRL